MEINIEGYSYYFKNDENLDEKDFIDRCWYVAKNLPKNPESFNNFKKYARIWSNMKNLKCRYEPELEKIVKEYSNTE